MSDMTSTIGEWTGRPMIDTIGEKIGTVQDVHFDNAMEKPKWLVVKSGLFGTKKSYVPAQDIRMDGDKIRVPYTEGRVKNAPDTSRTDALSHDEEQELYLYYGLDQQEPIMVSAATASVGGMDDIERGPELTPPEPQTPREHETVGGGRRES